MGVDKACGLIHGQCTLRVSWHLSHASMVLSVLLCFWFYYTSCAPMAGGDWHTPRAVVPFLLLGFLCDSLGTVGLLCEGGVPRGGWGWWVRPFSFPSLRFETFSPFSPFSLFLFDYWCRGGPGVLGQGAVSSSSFLEGFFFLFPSFDVRETQPMCFFFFYLNMDSR